jgi:hypothetical protein
MRNVRDNYCSLFLQLINFSFKLDNIVFHLIALRFLQIPEHIQYARNIIVKDQCLY